ncbi:hypothetical protein N7535_005462 [Penicillium sp. DV-2018c]|nr:hypothetical protein N7535_005462 [Penicillium sp. DV-2018c]
MQLRIINCGGEADKVIYASTYLRGQAVEWLVFTDKPQKDWGDITREIFASYTVFKQKLEQTFGDIDATRTAERRLDRLRQTGSASVYAAEFQQIISHLDFDEDTYIWLFERGLKEDIKDELMRIDRPEELHKMIELAVKFDNRLYERKLQRREQRQGGNVPYRYRRHEGRRGQQRQQPREYSDPYGPQPMELDAARLPAEEQKRRKDNNLCFNCGKAGHQARECRGKHNDAKRLRATRSNEVRPQQLRATQEEHARDSPEGSQAPWMGLSQEQIQPAYENRAEAIRKATKGKTADTFADDIEYRGLNSAEHTMEGFPEIDWENIESQGWTQYGPWNTIDSQELSRAPQDADATTPDASTNASGTPETLETPPAIPGTTTPEQPHQDPKKFDGRHQQRGDNI